MFKQIVAAIIISAVSMGAMADNKLNKFKAQQAKTVLSCEIAENYQRVFKNLNQGAASNSGATWLSTNIVTDSMLYNELGEAEISIKQTNPFGDIYFLAFEIVKVDAETTDMKVFVKNKEKRSAKMIKDLVGEFSYDCKAA